MTGKPIRKQFKLNGEKSNDANIKAWGEANPFDPKYKLMRKIRWLKIKKIATRESLAAQCCVPHHYIFNFTRTVNKTSIHVKEFIERVEPVVNWLVIENKTKVYDTENTRSYMQGKDDYYTPFANIVDLYEEMSVMGCVVRPPRTPYINYLTAPVNNPVKLVYPELPIGGKRMRKGRIEEIKKRAGEPAAPKFDNIQLDVVHEVDDINDIDDDSFDESPPQPPYMSPNIGELDITPQDDMCDVAMKVQSVIAAAFARMGWHNTVGIKVKLEYTAQLAPLQSTPAQPMPLDQPPLGSISNPVVITFDDVATVETDESFESVVGDSYEPDECVFNPFDDFDINDTLFDFTNEM